MFACQVRKAVGEVIGRYPNVQTAFQHHTSVSAGNKIFRLQFCDKSLYALLSQSIDNLRPYIEAYPADFLRGFFDAEGSAWVRHDGEAVVKYSNTKKNFINCVRELLINMKIFPAPKLVSEQHVYVNGERRKRPKTLYSLLIYRKDSIRRFMSLIGSSIPRKRLKI
jgi:intein-encoded DNA endonuclease-like protein